MEIPVRRRFVAWLAASAGIVLTLLITAADAQLSALGRRVAAEQIAPRVSKGVRVWANGEWGFEWYALKAGAIPAAKQPPYPSAGDVLVSVSSGPHVSLDLFPHRELIATITEKPRLGRIMDYSSNIGFYSNGFGYFPWGLGGKGGIEYFSVWRMR